MFGLDGTSFAKSLEEEGDWYRAIGQWKELRFETTASDSFWEINQHILFDLWQARQFELGLSELQSLYTKPKAQQSGIRNDLIIWKGLFQYKLSRFAEAEFSFRQANSKVYIGLLQARGNRLDDAKSSWQGMALPDPTALHVDTRNTLLAAGLSSILPGSGQFYAGHWYDGAQALAFCGFFGLSTYGTYLYDSKYSSNFLLTALVGGVSAIFYASNVYGAYKTAEYFNQNQENNRTGFLESAVFSLELPNLTKKE
jgi:TM2 domain-containing membrane protein YozV